MGAGAVTNETGSAATQDQTQVNQVAGAAGVNNNFGETLGSLSGLVYVDANNSGSYVAGDALLSGVTLTLSGTDANGHAVSATTTTNGSGQYTFGNLLAGTYTVTETQPAGYGEGKDTLGTYTVGAGAVTNETGSAATQDQTQVNQVAGAAGVNNNFGETLGSLSGLVYVDANNSGSYVAGDALLSGVTLTLSGTDANGHAVSATTTTNGSGQYTFGNLLAGTYTVTETQPAGYGEGKDTLGTYTVGAGAVTNETGSAATQDQTQVNQVAGAAGVNNNFGETLGSLSGLVYVDANNSGSYVAGDALLSGVTLTLSGTDANGHAVSATTTTNGSGQYTFGNLLAGTYTVTETQPAGYGEGKDTLGTYTVGAGAVTNETGSAATQDQTQVNQVAGAAGVNNNFGETLGSLSGLVYVDANNSGSYVAGDALLSGVTLTLSGTDANGHAVSATTTTNGSGQYTFGNLLAGTYTVTETQPAGYGEGKDTLGTYTVGAGAVTNETGSAATQDQTQVNQVAGAAGVNNNFGEVVPAAPTTGCIDALAFNDTNGDGIYQTGETGHAGISVSLISLGADGKFGTADDKVLKTVTTGADGTYDFNNLAPGKYAVEFCVPTTSGISFTTPGSVCGTANYWNQHQNCWDGNTTNDSPGTTDICYKVTNPCTGSNSGAGLLIGDWNKNGTSSGEHTIYCSASQAQAILASSDNSDARYTVAKEAITGWLNYLQTGTCDANTKADINNAVQWLCQHSSNQTTDWYGNGSLVLNSDNCKVAYSSTDWHSTTTTNTGWGYWGWGTGSCGGSTGSSCDGQTLANNLHTDNTENCNVQLVTVAAGPCTPVNVGIQSATASAACVEGTVFLDANGNGVFNNGEKGEAGVIVTLKAMSNSGNCDSTVATTTTDANGAYSFENLSAGQYQVTYSNLPSGYAFDQNNIGNGTSDFWLNHGSLWNGTSSGQICYTATDPVSHTTSPGGILIGDFSHNGNGVGENTIYYSYAEAQTILSASAATESSDARYIVAKDLISEWLNTLQTGSCTSQQYTDISNAVTWLQQHSPDENYSGTGDGNLVSHASSYACSSSSNSWTSGSWNCGSGQSIDKALCSDITTSSVTQTLTVDPGQCTTNNVAVVQVSGSGCQSTSYWQSNTSTWDGSYSGGLCYSVSGQSAPSLLIGDCNHNGKADNGESTLCLSVSTAEQILNSNSTDARYTVEKQLITSWLNDLAGNSCNQVQTDINNAITWLKCNTANGSGDVTTDPSHAMSSTSICFNTAAGTNPDAAHSGCYYGAAISNALGYYNNSGAGISHDAAGAYTGDLVTLVGYQQYESCFVHH